MKKIIFDTDIGGDCDDAGALALIHQAENLGLAKLVACVLSVTRFDGAGCLDVINRYYGHVVPIGQWVYYPESDADAYYKDSYGTVLYRNYEHSYKTAVPPCAIKVLRKALAENTGEKITLVVVGSFENVSNLMRSGPDEISELTGMELMKQQVDCIVAAAGNFVIPDKVESNISSSIHGAINVCKNSPVPIVFTHYTEGKKVLTGKIIHETDPENPVGIAYYICMKGDNRFSWDPMAAFYAIYGCEDIFRLTNPGTITVASDGMSTFEEHEGGQHRLIYCNSYEATAKRIDEALMGVYNK